MGILGESALAAEGALYYPDWSIALRERGIVNWFMMSGGRMQM